MKKILFLMCFMACAAAFAQGTIKGKITDESGDAAIGATVMIKSTTIGVSTDLDGNYSITINDAGPKILVVSYISFKTIETPVKLANNETVIKNFVLQSDSKVLGEVEVVGKASKAKEYYMEKVKMNSATTLDYISSETMKKTGDANVAAATARVSGVATNSGGLITIRGIGDRYVKTALNGARIPTLDPLTNNIKLDIFPASLVDNIIITKTASPDLPGDWAGAYLSVETKDYPDNLQINVESVLGYNAQSSFKNVLTSQHSSTDWLGYDNGLREYKHEKYQANTTSISTNIPVLGYQEFMAIGLGGYFKSLGVNESDIWDKNSDLYSKLGLIQLGLLPQALIDDPKAVAAAKAAYLTAGYHQQAFHLIHAPTAEAGQSFPNNWNTFMRKAPLNFSQSFSIGNQTKFLGKSFGIIAGFRYNTSVAYDGNATKNSLAYTGLIPVIAEEGKQKISKETNGWSALVNLACKLNANNSISVLFMPNLTGVNNVRNEKNVNVIDKILVNEYPAVKYGKDQFYESRRQLVYQLKSEHYIPGSKIKLDFNTSYTAADSKAPDFKRLRYADLGGPSHNFLIGASNGPIERLFRYLSENIWDNRLSFECPIGSSTDANLVRKIKLGAAYQYNYRKADNYSYFMWQNDGAYVSINNDEEDLINYFSLSEFEMYDYTDADGKPQTSIKKFYYRPDDPGNNTFGRSNIKALFGMVDYSIISSLRISGGVRVEQFNIHADVDEFDLMGYEKNNLKRIVTTLNSGNYLINPVKTQQTSFLPSANVIYKLKKEEAAPVNLRFNYSQTLARPSLRELNDAIAFDYEFNIDVKGNSELKTVKINNYDVRLESCFKSGDNLSLSIFYKDFINHIQMTLFGPQYTWVNSIGKSYVQGIEVEGKKSITKNLEFRANLTLVKSNSSTCRYKTIKKGIEDIIIPTDTVQIPMFGQAPYIINGMLSYTFDSAGLGITASYNVQGPRLVIIGMGNDYPDVYEMRRHLMDLKISKTLGKHFGMSFKIKDVFNTRITRSYKFNNEWLDFDYDSYRYGSIYELGISYKI